MPMALRCIPGTGAAAMIIIRLMLPLVAGVLAAAEPAVLDSFDEITLKAGNEKVRVTAVDGHAGKAVRLDFSEGCASSYAMGRVRGRPEWDQAAGISFRVKG